MCIKKNIKLILLNTFICVFLMFANLTYFGIHSVRASERNGDQSGSANGNHLRGDSYATMLKYYGTVYTNDPGVEEYDTPFDHSREASQDFKAECPQLYGDFSRNIQNLFQSDISPSSAPGTQSLDSYIDRKREQCKDQIVESYRKIESIDLKGYNSKKQRSITIFYSWREAYKNIKQTNLEGSRDIKNFITHYEQLKNNECYKKGLREAPGEISKWNLDKDDLEEFLEYSAKENCWDLKNEVLAFIENKNRKGTWSKVQSKFNSCINTASLDCVKNLYSGPSGGQLLNDLHCVKRNKIELIHAV